MIYATMCVGNQWITKYKEVIDSFSEKNVLHILTDDVHNFNNSICHQYTRQVFSYYEKINLILKLLKEQKQRITYIDVTNLSSYDTTKSFDNDSLYTECIFSLDEDNSVTSWFTELEHELQKTILKQISYDGFIESYIAEGVVSFPYISNIMDIVDDSKILQKFLEKIYNKNTITKKRLDKYKHGIGYGEGWALTCMAIKHNIPTKSFDWRRVSLI